MKNGKSIGVLGLWHLGCVYAASLASKGFNITGFDENHQVIQSLLQGKPPIFEPGLEELLKKHLGKNLEFTQDPTQAISNKDYIFVTMDIPVSDKDEVDLRSFDKLSEYILKFASPNTVIVISSQIPVGTSRKLQDKFTKLKKNISVIYFPENLRLGNAFESFLEPQRIILGGEDRILKKFLEDFNFTKIPSFLMSLESAEMSKHSLNAYLATCISFSSELGDICELTGANMDDVVKALKSERRVSPNAPLNPGLGFAGGTLGRDIKTLMSVSGKFGYKPSFLPSIYKVNRTRIKYLVKRIENNLGNLKNKRIGILGLTYKPGTDTLRRSMSLELAKVLNKYQVKLKAFDPMIQNSVKSYNFIEVNSSLEDFFKDIDVAILMTEWPEFKEINPKLPAKLMKQKIIIDTKNFLDKISFKSAGFKVLRIGEGK